MIEIELRHANPDALVRHLDSQAGISMADLQATLANLIERIASLGKDCDGLGEAFRWFNERVSGMEDRSTTSASGRSFSDDP